MMIPTYEGSESTKPYGAMVEDTMWMLFWVLVVSLGIGLLTWNIFIGLPVFVLAFAVGRYLLYHRKME